MRRIGLFLLLASAFSFAQITYSKATFGDTMMFSNSTAIGDFDRDGHPDVASMDGAQGLLTIFRGGTGGSLTQVAQYPIAANLNPAFIKTADINGDGKLDLVISKQYVPELEIWYGNGDATFHQGQILQLNAQSPEFALGDLNGDGSVDLVTMQDDGENPTVVTYLNDGHGNFTQKTAFSASPSRFSVADFTGDGKLDVLVDGGQALLVFPGKGDGTFGAAISSPVTVSQGSIVVGSFNHDSHLDVALRTTSCSTCITDKISVYLNNGSGKFTLASSVLAGRGTGPGGMAAGDLNNDGVQDLVISNDNTEGTTAADNAVLYLINDGTGHFGAQQMISSTESEAWTPSLRHLNRDSQLDIVVPGGQVYRFLAQNAPTNCTPPSSANLNATICSPTSSALSSNTFTVKAAGDSPAGVVRMELWVDGKKAFQNWGDQLKHTLTLTSGSHRLTIHAVDMYKGFGTATISVTAP